MKQCILIHDFKHVRSGRSPSLLRNMYNQRDKNTARNIDDDRGGMFSGPRVLFAMFCLLVAFAVINYAISGSIFTAFWRTFIASICLQFGYFAVVMYMVLRQVKARAALLPPKPSNHNFNIQKGQSTHSGTSASSEQD
jgi:hypothetical protein